MMPTSCKLTSSRRLVSQTLTSELETNIRKFVIERALPGVCGLSNPELGGAARTSNGALAALAPKVQWVHSYVTADKTFCIYLAEDEDAIYKHAELSGFPATIITEVTGMIDPSTAGH